jgi:uncharacterized membrane protein YdcZ (DUF606 family)
MGRRLISATLLGLMLIVVRASIVVADHGVLEGELTLSPDSVLMALITSFLTGVVCFTLMVWDPKGRK